MDLSNIRIKEHFGLVTDDTKTTQFAFLVSPPKNRGGIEEKDIICLDHPIYGEVCQVLAEVKEVRGYEEKAGSSIRERAWTMIATAKIIGYIDLRKEELPLHKLLAPPNAGSNIYMPYANFLEDVFSRGVEGRLYKQPLYLGKTETIAAAKNGADQQMNFYLDAADLTSQHTLISATDGIGKTHAASIIVEELANKTGHPIIIFDAHNEYETMGGTAKRDQNVSPNFQTSIIDAKNAAKTNPDIIMKKIKPNEGIILTAENLSPLEKTDYYVSVLNSLVKSRQEKTVQPVLLIVEDAENFPPQKIQETLSTRNGLATILIASHPTMLGGKVLSQIQNQIIGKTSDPEDLAYLKNLIGNSDEQLSNLGVGEWMISSLNIIRPTKVHIR